MRRRSLILAAASFAAVAPGAASEPATILTVLGKIRRSNTNGKAFRFTEVELMALPKASITTSTVWTPRRCFEGPRLRDVLGHVGADGATLRVTALSDYSVAIPTSDATRYGIILAHSQDGRRMERNHFGPLWVIYPRDQFPDELDGPMAQAKFIWQVRSIEVQ